MYLHPAQKMGVAEMNSVLHKMRPHCQTGQNITKPADKICRPLLFQASSTKKKSN